MQAFERITKQLNDSFPLIDIQPKLKRSSCPEVFCRKDVLRNFAKFTGKNLCQNLFFNKVASLSPATLLKKRLWHRCFPVNFAKLLKRLFLQNTSGGCFWLNKHKLITRYPYVLPFLLLSWDKFSLGLYKHWNRWQLSWYTYLAAHPVGIYLLKVNNRNMFHTLF